MNNVCATNISFMFCDYNKPPVILHGGVIAPNISPRFRKIRR
jgi:hypothetical protein